MISNRRLPAARARFWIAAIAAAAAIFTWNRASSVNTWWLSRQSIADIRKAAEAAPKDLSAWSLYAERAMAEGQGEAAAAAYGRAVSLLPLSDRSPRAWRLLADGAYAASRFGSAELAESMARRLVGGPSDSVRGSLALGIAAMRVQDYHRADKWFRSAISLAPNSAEAHSRLGTTALAQGQPLIAIEALQTAVRLAPRDAAMRADLGEALALTSRFNEAMKEYAEAARLKPDSTDYSTQHALAAASAARTDAEFGSASTLIASAMKESQSDPALYLTLAGLQMRFARMDEAKRTYEAVVGRMPDHPDAWFNLSTVYTRLGDSDSAAFARKRFQEILDRQTKVVELTKRSLMRPRDAMLMAELSAALRRAGDTQGAYKALQQAAALDPSNRRLQATLEQATQAVSGGGGTLSSEGGK